MKIETASPQSSNYLSLPVDLCRVSTYPFPPESPRPGELDEIFSIYTADTPPAARGLRLWFRRTGPIRPFRTGPHSRHRRSEKPDHHLMAGATHQKNTEGRTHPPGNSQMGGQQVTGRRTHHHQHRKFYRPTTVSGEKDQTLQSSANFVFSAEIKSATDGSIIWNSGSISQSWPFFSGQEAEADKEVTLLGIRRLADRMSQNY